jgi:hypothetical protein
MKDLAAVVEHLRQLNIRSVEQFQRQKFRADSIFARFDETQGDLSQLVDKCANKDLLIRTLVDLMHKMGEFSVATLVRWLRETTVKPSFVKKGGIDFNLESLCRYLENTANEKVRKSHSDETTTEKVKKIKKNQKKIEEKSEEKKRRKIFLNLFSRRKIIVLKWH